MKRSFALIALKRVCRVGVSLLLEWYVEKLNMIRKLDAAADRKQTIANAWSRKSTSDQLS
eukprot:3701564-Amphidinium_carterae.1